LVNPNSVNYTCHHKGHGKVPEIQAKKGEPAERQNQTYAHGIKRIHFNDAAAVITLRAMSEFLYAHYATLTDWASSFFTNHHTPEPVLTKHIGLSKIMLSKLNN